MVYSPFFFQAVQLFVKNPIQFCIWLGFFFNQSCFLYCYRFTPCAKNKNFFFATTQFAYTFRYQTKPKYHCFSDIQWFCSIFGVCIFLSNLVCEKFLKIKKTRVRQKKLYVFCLTNLLDFAYCCTFCISKEKCFICLPSTYLLMSIR